MRGRGRRPLGAPQPLLVEATGAPGRLRLPQSQRMGMMTTLTSTRFKVCTTVIRAAHQFFVWGSFQIATWDESFLQSPTPSGEFDKKSRFDFFPYEIFEVFFSQCTPLTFSYPSPLLISSQECSEPFAFVVMTAPVYA